MRIFRRFGLKRSLRIGFLIAVIVAMLWIAERDVVLLSTPLAADTAAVDLSPAPFAETHPKFSGATFIRFSEPLWVVPSERLPKETWPEPGTSNNNVDIEVFDGRLYLAWRNARSHFASSDVALHVVSTPTVGLEESALAFQAEESLRFGADLREPRFISVGGRLHLYFLVAGTNPLAFAPRGTMRISRAPGEAQWSLPGKFGFEGEVPWEVKRTDQTLLMSSYAGNHYGLGESQIAVFVRSSTDGVNWSAAGLTERVLLGSDSEVSFEKMPGGELWAIARNEDGDQTGFGTRVYRSDPKGEPWRLMWSERERYDSPRLFRHRDQLYLIARRDIDGPYDQRRTRLPFEARRWLYQLTYWFRPKRTALYRIDSEKRRVVFLADLPSSGDTAYPAIRALGADTFLVANYTSPIDDPDRFWLHGQVSGDGTAIYLLKLHFAAE